MSEADKKTEPADAGSPASTSAASEKPAGEAEGQPPSAEPAAQGDSPSATQSAAKHASRSATQPETSSRAAAPASPRRAVLPAIALLLSAGALGVAGYAVYHTQQLQGQWAVDVEAAVQRADALEQSHRALQRELDQTRQALQANGADQRSAIDTLTRRLDDTRDRLNALATTDRRQWQLAEAEYLLQLANQRLLMTDDVDSALALLRAADDILRELDDDALFPVRRALADEIAALKAVREVDVNGLYLRLDATAGLAADLRLIPEQQLYDETQDSAPTAEPQNWRQRLTRGWQAALEKFANAVQIHRREDIYRPALAPSQEAAVRHNVQLMFEQAQLALLAGNQALYTRSLEQAREWLQSYYTLEPEATTAVVSAIDALADVNIDRPLPDIARSRRLLKRYIAELHGARPGVEAPAVQQAPSAAPDETAPENNAPASEGNDTP